MAYGKVVIRGQISQLGHGKVLLESYLFGPPTEVQNGQLAADGHFELTLEINQIGFYRLSIKSPEYESMDNRFINLVLDTATAIMIEATAPTIDQNYTVEGSDDSKLLKDINLLLMHSFDRLDSLDAQYKQAKGRTGVHIDSLSRSFQGPYAQIVNQREDFVRDIILDNPSSLSILTIINYLDKDQDIDAYQVMDRYLYKRYPTLPYVNDFHRRVRGYSKLAVGAEAPALELIDSKGNAFRLSEQHGKVVLLSFWASDNIVSRQGNEYLQQVQKNHKKDAFELVSVSMDQQKERWLAAIQKDKLKWTQLSDLQGKNSTLNNSFDLQQLPKFYLIGEDGKIVAKGFLARECEAKIQAYKLKSASKQ